MTAATPSTAITPVEPFTPIATISKAAMISVESVSPEMGLLDDPIMPTRLPLMAAKKKPKMIITTAETPAAA